MCSAHTMADKREISPGRETDSFLDWSVCSCDNDNESRIMKCSRITLIDRKENVRREIEKQRCNNYQRIHQPLLHNYLSWLNKPHSVYEEQQPYLTICNLVLPKNVSVFGDGGAQSEKWVQKRPRLQSGKSKKNSRKLPEPGEVDEETKLSEDETDSECMEIQQIIEDYEIDENVQRLIQEAAEYDLKMEEEREKAMQREMEYSMSEEFSKKRHRKSAKHSMNEGSETKEKIKSKLTRTVTLSLSKPPSPETVQVIRVDVTSNYSLEEWETAIKIPSNYAYDNVEENSIEQEQNDVTNTESNRLRLRKSLIKCAKDPPELTLHCQKLALSDRTSNVCH